MRTSPKGRLGGAWACRWQLIVPRHRPAPAEKSTLVSRACLVWLYRAGDGPLVGEGRQVGELLKLGDAWAAADTSPLDGSQGRGGLFANIDLAGGLLACGLDLLGPAPRQRRLRLPSDWSRARLRRLSRCSSQCRALFKRHLLSRRRLHRRRRRGHRQILRRGVGGSQGRRSNLFRSRQGVLGCASARHVDRDLAANRVRFAVGAGLVGKAGCAAQTSRRRLMSRLVRADLPIPRAQLFDLVGLGRFQLARADLCRGLGRGARLTAYPGVWLSLPLSLRPTLLSPLPLPLPLAKRLLLVGLRAFAVARRALVRRGPPLPDLRLRTLRPLEDIGLPCGG